MLIPLSTDTLLQLNYRITNLVRSSQSINLLIVIRIDTNIFALFGAKGKLTEGQSF